MKLIEVVRRYSHAWDAHYAEALLNLFKKSRAPLMRLGAVSFIAVMLTVAAAAFEGQDNNPPWYPSLQAFEHYNSGRSHVFTQAQFLGSLDGPNKVAVAQLRRWRVPLRSGSSTARSAPSSGDNSPGART